MLEAAIGNEGSSFAASSTNGKDLLYITDFMGALLAAGVCSQSQQFEIATMKFQSRARARETFDYLYREEAEAVLNDAVLPVVCAHHSTENLHQYYSCDDSGDMFNDSHTSAELDTYHINIMELSSGEQVCKVSSPLGGNQITSALHAGDSTVFSGDDGKIEDDVDLSCDLHLVNRKRNALSSLLSSCVVPVAKRICDGVKSSESVLLVSNCLKQVVVETSDFDHFVMSTLTRWFQVFGQAVTRLNNLNNFVDRESPTSMWFHILNEFSRDAACVGNKSAEARFWSLSVKFNVTLIKHLKTVGFPHPSRHAIVEVPVNETCLYNAVLSCLYLMQWFVREKARRAKDQTAANPPITALHLKHWTMMHMALNSHKLLRFNPTQSFLSLYKLHHEDPAYRVTHPFNVCSLQLEFDDLFAEADGPNPTSYVSSVASAVRLVGNRQAATTEDEMKVASAVIDIHVQKFKANRKKVFGDFLRECKEGMMLHNHCEVLQLLAIQEVLGGLGYQLYDAASSSWSSLGEELGVLSDDSWIRTPHQQITIIMMKNMNHFFSVIDLVQTDDSLIISEEQSKMFSKVKGVWKYPSFDRCNLCDLNLCDRINANAVLHWTIADKETDIYKYNKKIISYEGL